jgi:ribosomal protein L11 methyltransferase
MEPTQPEATNLIIDPGLAFGTGTHPTTHLCLEYLSNSELTGKTVIDYGCGSGILAIAALALGADKAIGVDVDSKSIEASKKNAERNQVASRFIVGFPDAEKSAPGDIVIANILADTLITLYQEILLLTKPGTKLLLCGILTHQEQRVCQHYADEFSFTRLQEEDWILLVGIRKPTGSLSPLSKS